MMPGVVEIGPQKLECFDDLRVLLDGFANPSDAGVAFDVATRAVVDALLARDDEVLAKMAAELRVLNASRPESGEDLAAGRVSQLLASVVAGLQRLPSSADRAAVAEGTHAHMMLACIADRGEIANVHLRKEVGLAQDEASRVGRQLAERGFVVKTQLGRTVWWEATDRGRRMLGDTDANDELHRGRARWPVLGESPYSSEQPVEVDLERIFVERRRSLQSTSRLATAMFLKQGGAQEISRRLLLWSDVRAISEGPLQKFEFRYPAIDQGVEQHRMLLWDSLREVAPAHSVSTFMHSGWPVPAPAYDGCVLVRDQDGAARGIVLLDARVSPDEFQESPVQVRTRGKKRALKNLMSKTRDQLDARSTTAWELFPDAWTRIAFMQGILDSMDVPVWHLNLYFVASGRGSPLDGVAPLSEDEWGPTIERVRRDFRLDANDIGHRIRREFILEPLVLPTERDESANVEIVTVEVPLRGEVGESALPPTFSSVEVKTSRVQGVAMGKGNDKDRYVVPRPGEGWAVVREDHQRASAVLPTQREAIARAKEITGNLGGGEVRVQNRHGEFREGDRVRKR